MSLLVLVLGLHWALLQTAAWTRMLVDFSASMPLREAFSRTFDGRHPCRICLAIQKARQAEERSAPTIRESRLRWEFDLPVTPSIHLLTPVADLSVPTFGGYAGRVVAPPKPRPRFIRIA